MGKITEESTTYPQPIILGNKAGKRGDPICLLIKRIGVTGRKKRKS